MTMTWRFLGIAFALVLVVVVAVIMIGGILFPLTQFFLFVPDGINLLKNGSFEDGKLTTDPTDDPNEFLLAGPNTIALCDGSTRIDHWVPSGLGPPNPTKCLNGRPFHVLDYVAPGNPPDHCEPNVPPCPNSIGVAGQEGNRFVNLTNGGPPRNYGSVSQDVQTNVGQTYQLSFFIGRSSAWRIACGQSAAVYVESAGVTITDNPLPAPLPSALSNWLGHSTRFDAVNETTTLIFHGASVIPGNTKGTAYIGLDNVSLQKVCAIFIAFTVGCP